MSILNENERILEIGQHLAKLQARVAWQFLINTGQWLAYCGTMYTTDFCVHFSLTDTNRLPLVVTDF